VVFASSGCVYPVGLQADTRAEVRLTEAQVGPPHDPDGMYGWAKLSAELSLAEYRRQYGLNSISLRYFTVYGERCDASRAVIAMMARAAATGSARTLGEWAAGSQLDLCRRRRGGHAARRRKYR
jgi:nucleoside-diphosphate-sugar epimerase